VSQKNGTAQKTDLKNQAPTRDALVARFGADIALPDLRIAAEHDLLADALTYFARGDEWFDAYKALECLRNEV
jgi:hypothetical protein